MHVKVLRGKKTDSKDSRWRAGLLRHGLVEGSFIPPRDIRELRDLTRRRRTLLSDGAAERNRVQKILEDANVKIGNVLTDVFGVSGQAMLEALLENKSAGKRKSGRTRPGNRWLRATLTQTAWAGAASKSSLFHARYQRLKLRRGSQRAVIAIAHAQLRAIYWALRNGTPYPEQMQRLEQDQREAQI